MVNSAQSIALVSARLPFRYLSMFYLHTHSLIHSSSPSINFVLDSSLVFLTDSDLKCSDDLTYWYRGDDILPESSVGEKEH